MRFLLPPMQNRIIVLLIAAAVDLLIGDPHGLWHPVQGIGLLISAFEKILRRLFAIPPRGEGREERDRNFAIRERAAGALMVFLVLTVSVATVFFLLALCGRIHPHLRTLAEGVLCGRLLALRSLGEAGFSVRDPLLRGEIEEARRAVSMIVGRDTDRLDAEGIARAAVETVAENTSDGVTAPLFYMILLGGVGGIFYKSVNTMDSMTGYKNARYRNFGTAAARLDDAVNFLPARLTAVVMILACFLPGKEAVIMAEPVTEPAATDGGDRQVGRETGREKILLPDGRAALRVWRRDRMKSPSPNSAQTESVCAGALHLRLLGDTWYFGKLHHKPEIGDGDRKAEPCDITRAVRLMNRTAFLMLAAAVVLLAAIAAPG